MKLGLSAARRPTGPAPGPEAAGPQHPHWFTDFWAALVPLVLLKLGLVIYQLSASAAGEAIWRNALKSFLFYGSDVFSAAVLATLLATVRRVFRIERRWARRALSVPVQVAHALVAGFSTLSTVLLGGPLNKQLIDATIFVAENWTPQMAASSDDYLGLENIAIVAGAGVLSAALVVWAPRCLQGWSSRRSARIGGGILTLWAVLTLGVVPFMTSGRIGIRITSNGLEKSPWPELAWSYIRLPLLRALDRNAHHAPLTYRFDYRSRALPEAMVVTPLTEATPRRTSVLLIQLESIGARYLDAPDDPMPFVRGLRARPDAVTFGEHYATWSLTTHVLFSILCSEMPHPTHRSISFVNPAIPCVSLSERLHGLGYFTAMVTPSDLDFDQKRRFLRHRGFDETWDAKNLPGRKGQWQGAWGYEEKVAVPEVFRAIERAGERPFFIHYNSLAGHHPFIATEAQEDHPEETREANYSVALRAADDAVRDLVQGLEARGKLADTLVVILADHGESHGSRAGRNTWQPVVRVPMLVFGPQLLGHAGTVTDTTTQLDLAPTLLGLLKAPIPCTMKGRDLTQPSEARVAIFGGRPPRFQVGLVDAQWKFILEDGYVEMLFDLSVDRDEQNNLAAERPEITARYRALIDNWQFQTTELIENYASMLKGSGCRP